LLDPTPTVCKPVRFKNYYSAERESNRMKENVPTEQKFSL